jgi:hypothetical protein
MTLTFPGQRTARNLARRMEADACMAELLQLGPRAVFGMLQSICSERRYKAGWAAWCFREIFNAWPRPQDRGDPMPPARALEEWLRNRERRPNPRRRAS